MAMLRLVLMVLKIIPISIIVAIVFSWLDLLERLMREKSWEDLESYRLLNELNPELAKIVVSISHLITGLIGILIGVLVIKVIL